MNKINEKEKQPAKKQEKSGEYCGHPNRHESGLNTTRHPSIPITDERNALTQLAVGIYS